MHISTEDVMSVMDVHDEREALQKLKATLELLESYGNVIPKEGVCQDQVKAMIAECDLGLDDRYPVQSFTKLPSQQNVGVACEAITARAGQIVVDLIKKVGELIMKMINWLIKAVKGLFARHNTVHQRVVFIKHLNEANKAAKVVVGDAGEGSEVEAAQAALDEAMGRYKDHYTALAATLLTEGDYLGALKGIGLIMPVTVSLITEKVLLAENTIKEHPKDRIILAQQLASLAQPIPLAKLENVAAKYGPLQRKETLLDYFEALKAATDSLHDAHPAGQMDWAVAAQVLADPRAGFDEPIIAIPDDIQRVFNTLLSKVDSLMHPDITKTIDASLAAQYDAAMMALVADVHALTYYVEVVNVVLDTQVSIADSLYRCAASQFELYRAKATSSGEQAVVDKLNEIQAHLRTAITKR
jgi:hypothetical protein